MGFELSDGIALLALTAMEIVLGIDNIVFIAILSSRLPRAQQKNGRRVGLLLALVTRIALLATLSFILGLDKPVFSWTKTVHLPEAWFMVDADSHGHDRGGGLHDLAHGADSEQEQEQEGNSNSSADSEKADSEKSATDESVDEEAKPAQVLNEDFDGVSIRDLILLAGGLFLIAKSVFEIHEKIHDDESESDSKKKSATFVGVIIQIAIIDIVFSLDSVITAVGMVDKISIMIIAVVIAVAIMLIFSEVVARFVEENPTLKMLALSFLILIGVMLVAEGAGAHFDKGYIYFAMAFALIVEFLNMRIRGGHKKSESNADAPSSA